MCRERKKGSSAMRFHPLVFLILWCIVIMTCASSSSRVTKGLRSSIIKRDYNARFWQKVDPVDKYGKSYPQDLTKVSPAEMSLLKVPSIPSRMRRQARIDDEEDFFDPGFDRGRESVGYEDGPEGSGTEPRTYQANCHVIMPWRYDYIYKESSSYQQVTEQLEIFSDEITSTVTQIRPALDKNLNVTLEIDYFGYLNDEPDIRRSIISLSEGFINKIECFEIKEFSGVAGRCKADQLVCLDGSCLPQSNRCDGISDCNSGEDETDCFECGVPSFRCDNGHCLPDYRICDGVFDCLDFSDEEITCIYLSESTPDAQMIKIMSVDAYSPVKIVCPHHPPKRSSLGKHFPTNAVVVKSSLFMEQVLPGNAGLYRCSEEDVLPGSPSKGITLLDIKDIIPRFNGSKSFMLVKASLESCKNMVVEISFKPDALDGLLLAINATYSIFILKIELIDGTVSLKHYRWPQTLLSSSDLEVNKWHTITVTINDLGGFMTVDGETTATALDSDSERNVYVCGDIFLGLGAPEDDDSSFNGCISRLLIDGTVLNLAGESIIEKIGISPCDPCADNNCPEDGLCFETYSKEGYECVCPTHSAEGICKNIATCYPGLCGTGRCVNQIGEFKCFCPFGKTGKHCEHDVIILQPAFDGDGYITISLPNGNQNFNFGMDFKAQTLDDMNLLNLPYTVSGVGHNLSLTLTDGRLQLICHIGGLMSNESIPAEQWTSVIVDVAEGICHMSVNGTVNPLSRVPEVDLMIDFDSHLTIGNRVSTDEQSHISDGFKGCMKEFTVMGEKVRLLEQILTSANVDQCSRCLLGLCNSNGKCMDVATSAQGYACDCSHGYSGSHCELENQCDQYDCLNGEKGVKECPSQNVTVLSHTWTLNATALGDTFNDSCPVNMGSTFGIWTCNNNSKWNETPDLSRCRNHMFLFLPNNKTSVYAADNLTELAGNMQDYVLSPGDLLQIVNELENLQDKHSYNDIEKNVTDALPLSKKFIRALVNVTSGMVEQEEAWQFMPAEKKSNASSTIQKALVSVALKIAELSPSELLLNYSQDNTDVRIVSQPKDYFATKENRLYKHDALNGTELLLPDDFSTNYTPDKRDGNESDGRVVVVYNSFKKLHCLTNTIPCNQINSNVSFEGAEAQVNSGIIGATIGFGKGWKKTSANGYVELKLYHIYNGSSYEINNVVCKWWNTETSKWSSEGCHLVETNDFFSVCHCDHLTNLAVVMDVRGLLDRGTRLWKTLQWITTIGCSFSIICLAIGIACFLLLKAAREKKKSVIGAKKYMIRLHLCSCLLIAEFVLLIGLDATHNKILCTVVAAALHFFFLSVFTWSAIEALNLYLACMKVFETPISQKHYLIAGYSIPFGLVGATLVVTQTNGYGTEHACWLAPSGSIIWSFVGTVAFIMLINGICFGMVMKIVCCDQRLAGATARSSAKSNVRKIVGSIAIFMALGLTWITGFFFMAEASMYLAVAFTLLNSLQGAFIFFFGIIFEEDVRKELQNIIKVKLQDERLPSFLHANTNAPSTSTSNATYSTNTGVELT